MADEITLSIALTLSNGELEDRGPTARMSIHQSNRGMFAETLECTSDPTYLSFTTKAIVSPGVTLIQNLSTANGVYFGPSDGAGGYTSLLFLAAAESQAVRLDNSKSSTDFVFVAEEGTTVDVLVKIYDN